MEKKTKQPYETPETRVTALVQCRSILTGSATIDVLLTEDDYDSD